MAKKVAKKEMECNDVNCPEHGTLSTRGMVMDGVVTSDKMDGTVIVQKNYLKKVSKFNRYKSSKSRIPAHNPACMNVREGDKVRIMECRKLSKTVSFVIIEKLSSE
jgi:small subunit ribosomal protein S17